ncbi:glycosyltransferase family 87 protein [Nocardia coffeae]|uniref:glycosyltransferase family 87 protein n=1 Tax=Nocardia coffeae TaxID=2873381 RepID=UPI0027E156F4|nr:glycosyltransferase family 87 protein [Nocardia coffeae]
MNERSQVADPDELPPNNSVDHSCPDQVTGRRRMVAIAIALFVISAIVCMAAGLWRGYIDLQVYRNGARIWLDGGNLYGPMPKVGGLGLPFTYPPLAALLFTPLALLPLFPAEWLVLVLAIASLALTVWLVLHRLRPRLDRTITLSLVIGAVAVLGLSEPIRQTYNFGQINLFLMAAISLDLLVRKPFWPRGMLIGIAVAIKLTPGGFLLYFLVRRDWRSALTVMLSALGAIVVGFILFPHESAQYWFHTMLDTGRIGPPYFAGNQSLKGFAFRLGLDSSAATILWLVTSLIAVVLAAILMKRLFDDAAFARRHESPDAAAPASAAANVAALTVNAAAVLLVSPISWSHHWVWVAPAALVAADAIDRSRRSRRYLIATAAIAVMFMVGPQWLLPHGGDHERRWAVWEQLVGSSYVLVTLAVLVVAVVAYRPIYRGVASAGVRNAANAAE